MIQITSKDLAKLAADALILPVSQEQDFYHDPALKRVLTLLGPGATLAPAKGETRVHIRPDGLAVQKVIFVGLGRAEEADAEIWRRAAGAGVLSAQEAAPARALLPLPAILPADHLAFETVAAALAEGALLANYRFDRFKSAPKTAPLKSLQLITDTRRAKRLKPLLAKTTAVCRGTLLARDWVNLPANEKHPRQLADRLQQAAAEAGIRVRRLDPPQLRRQGLEMLLAVGAGSSHPPCLLVLDYHPPRARRTLALVGKGVTFDAGGLNLKPTGSIEMMKIDMAGAAAVAGTVITAARLKLDQRIVGVMPLVENMVSGNAFRPGDIIRTYSGQTVEIGNTDAEGRLILADALAWAEKRYKPDAIIDLATLTGACVVALGEGLAGLFTADGALRDRIESAGREVHERCWPLPMPDDYREMLKSEVADMRNIGPKRWGGAIVAALFLSRFVKETAWAHIDIAGPAHAAKSQPYCGAGGTGFGVRLLCRLLERWEAT
jgi:leucyl aminopeptidase